MVPRFPDSIGYLIELRDARNEGWFALACDLAIASDGARPSNADLEKLLDLLLGVQTYAPLAASVPPTPTLPSPAAAAPFLERLGGFAGFKKLSGALDARFSTQLSLVFGRNGSGKSSLCQALKLLASADPPANPIQNVRAQYPPPPSFLYKFRTAAEATWNEARGLGAEEQSLKYFDASVAHRHITGAVEPEAIVEVSAFRTEVFDRARTVVTAFQAHAARRAAADTQAVQAEIDALKARLASAANVAWPPLASLTPSNPAELEAAIAGVGEFGPPQDARMAELAALERECVSASSEEGIRALRAQSGLLHQLSTQAQSLVDLCRPLDLADIQETVRAIVQKKSARQELHRDAFPAGVEAATHHALIVAASREIDLGAARPDGPPCPLCQRQLDAGSAQLFQAYARHVTSRLESEIAGLERKLDAAAAQTQRISSFRLGDFAATRDILPAGTLDAIIAATTAVVGSIPSPQRLSEADRAAYARFLELPALIAAVAATKARIDGAIAAGGQSKSELAAKLAGVRGEIATLKLHQAVWAERDALRAVCQRIRVTAPARVGVTGYDFASLLRAMTNKGKEAHKDLVMAQFESRLDDEYRKLSGATLAEMGVRLRPSGDQQDITVTPRVGGAEVSRVLSEGELKVHALAIFMCEAETRPGRVLVFDDPVTSFDYDYVSNFCERLRDLVRDQPLTQVIVLTHNWDFFVNLQSTMNRSPGLNARMTVQVLENCDVMREYKEEVEALCAEIEPVLAGPGEPSEDRKSQVAASMRRLAETVVNKYAFNNQRHQYKQKSQAVTEFHAFTKAARVNYLYECKQL